MTSPTTHQLLQGALALHRLGNLRAAMEGYIKILGIDPQHVDALYYIAVVSMQEGDVDNCIKLAERALAAGKPQARAHNLLGQAHFRQGKHEQALASYNRAIAMQPDFADAFGNRANVLCLLGRHREALPDYDRALKIRPDSYEDWSNRGALLQDFDRFDEALASFDRSITLRPDFAGGHYNRANVLRDLAQLADARAAAGGHPPDPAPFDAAIAAYYKAITLNPQFPEAFLGRSFVHLMRGEWGPGFRDYEHRSKIGAPAYVPLTDPTWNGTPLTGERLVLVAEQGLGDTIMMCRFAPLLASQGYDVTILAKKAMQPLLSSLSGVSIATSPEELSQDKRPIRWLPLMNVPGVLGTKPDTLPAEVPYLKAEPERIATWAARLGAGGFKIGINWSTGHPNDGRRRDIPLGDFAPLAALPGVRLISLQKGMAVNQIELVPFRDKIEIIDADPNPDAKFFLDTAAVMTQLQLIVTCDTAVTHLAGALARPVFCAIPAIADWRWFLGRTDSPWYPTLKLFRQHTLNQWTDVLSRAAEAARLMI